jgi:peptidoglycan/LPS O-acetylase OafA/YrhL
MTTDTAAASNATLSNEPSRFVFIDGLRGIAAMLVVLVHISGALFMQYGKWLPAWLDSVVALGRVGVDIFSC